tara:strand:+ start:38 stop:2887 length:2850 start_codon:yes stop_codon:yes gene_type:complete
MSVQLVLYPQSYSGYSYNTFLTYNNYAANSYFSSSSFSNVMDIGQSNVGTGINNPSNYYTGAWFGYYSASTGATWNGTAAPTISGGNLTLTGGGGANLYSVCGVAQPIPNLIIGNWYDVIIEHTGVTGADGIYMFGAFGETDAIGNNGNNWPFQQGIGGNSTTHNFQAGFSTMKLLVTFFGKTAAGTTSHQVSSIRVREAASGATVNYTDFSDGQVICDQYAEENIPLTLSIDDFKNVAEKTQSYSKDFNLPNTKRNNKIFTHIFDITKTIETSYDFNPYAKTRAVLKQDGILIFEGSLRLINIIDKEGEISYNVNLYSEVVALADVLKDKTFADLDLAELEHDYNKTSIRNSWYNTTGLPLTNTINNTSFAYDTTGTISSPTDHTNVLKYPFVNWTGDIMIADGSTGNNSNLGFPELVTLQQAFRPFIQAKYLIDKIFFDAGYEYTSAFLDTDKFSKLFVDFNWGDETINPANSGYATYTLDTPYNYAPNGSWGKVIFPTDNFNSPDFGYDGTTSTFTSPADNTQYAITYKVWAYTAGSTGALSEIQMEWYKNASTPQSLEIETFDNSADVTANIHHLYEGSFVVNLDTGDELYLRWTELTGSSVATYQITVGQPSRIDATVSTVATGSAELLQTSRGSTNQWTFFKGILTMFNLITIPQPEQPNNILIEPYSDIFIDNPNGTTLSERSIQHDWTHKIDIDDIDLKPVPLTKNIILKYAEDNSDYPFRVYKHATKKLYGSKTIEGNNMLLNNMPGLTINLAESQEIVAEPFAATISKPLSDLWPNFVVPVIYSSNADNSEFSGFDNMPRILCNDGVVDLSFSGITYYIPEQNGVISENADKFLQFSHLSEIPTVPNTTLDFNFGECALIPPIGGSPIKNLYNEYYAPYFNELYNPNTRVMTIKVNLNASDINTFKFSDKVMIKNRIFRVNRIDYNPNELSTVEFILIT